MQKDNCFFDTSVYSLQIMLKKLLSFIKEKVWVSWCVYFRLLEAEAEEILSKNAGLSLPHKIRSCVCSFAAFTVLVIIIFIIILMIVKNNLFINTSFMQ